MPCQWQLASQIFVPMISGTIERQRDENRKNNALIAKTINDILLQVQPTMAQSTQGGNGWENTFHSSDNPMTQCDMGTAELMPFSIQPVQTTSQRAVSANDFLRAMAANMGTDRFETGEPKVARN